MPAKKSNADLDWDAAGQDGESLKAKLRRLMLVEGRSMNEAARIMGVSPTQAKGAKQRYGINNGRKGSEGLCRHDIRMLRAADGAGTRAEREAIGRKYGMSAEAVRMAVTRWRRHGRPVPVVTDGR